jgi:hypothetical protein
VAELFAVPPGVVTETFPVEPSPTTAVILVADLTENDWAAVPPKATAVAPLKLVPVMVTEVPGLPEAGVNDLIVGANTKVKVALLVAEPPGVVTIILPVEPLPTTAAISVLEFTIKEPAVLVPNLTPVAPLKLVPVMIISEPVPPLTGENEVIVGGE